MDLTVKSETWASATLLSVIGEIDLWSADRLRDALATAVDPAAPPQVIVDLRAVSFIDSTGLGVLAGALRASRDGAGDLALVVGPGPVSKVLSVTGMDRVFPIFGDLPAAKSGLVGTGPSAGDGDHGTARRD